MNKSKIIPSKYGSRHVHIANSNNIYDEDIKKYQSEINKLVIENNNNGDNPSDSNRDIITEQELDEILI